MHLININKIIVHAREGDNYVNATELCKSAGREFKKWKESKRASEFITALESTVGISDQALFEFEKTGMGGITWVHPRIAINIAQWVSPQFDVIVSGWVYDLMTGVITKNEENKYIRKIAIDSIKIHRQQEEIDRKNIELDKLKRLYVVEMNNEKLEQAFYMIQEGERIIFKACQNRKSPNTYIYKTNSNNPIRFKNVFKTYLRDVGIETSRNSFMLNDSVTLEYVFNLADKINALESIE